MEHIFQLLIAFLAGALVVGFGAFYTFNGRLSRLEGQLESLKGSLSNTFQYPLITGVPIPAPVIGKPVGGANALVDTLELEPSSIQQEEISTIFELITDGQALVNLVRGGYIGIKNIKLDSFSQAAVDGSDNVNYVAVISMENLTDQDIDFVIPKGQVFENQEPKSGRQNLATAKEQKETLLAQTSYNLTVAAHCMNKNLSGPNGSPGNITIFKIRDDTFEGQEELWQSVNDRVNKARLIVEGRKKSRRR
jgi:hypothetical protein